MLRGHVPPVVSHLAAKERLAATTSLRLAIGLPLHNREALTNLLEQLYDPASPNYRHFLTPEQFTAQFGPTEQDYQAVVNFAKANGLVVTGTHPNRMLLDVSGKVADIEKTFHVTLRTYQHPTEAREFYAPDVEPSVDANVPVQDISGLNNYFLPRPMLHKMTTANATPALGSGLGGSYLGRDFRNAYAPGTSLDGSGQIVGLLQFDGYLASDIAAYETQAGLTNVPPLQNVLLDGFSGVPTGNGGEVEVSLDIEMAVSMAPALSKVVVFEAGPYGYANDILNSMAASNQIKQFSSSWAWGFFPDATTDQIFKQLAAQGQSFFNASGDYDAWVGLIYTPCDNPYITLVGGTTLIMSGSGASYVSETVWNWGGGIGSGGGISPNYLIPGWQTNINMTANKGSTTMRNLPDVAMTADNVYVIADGGAQYIVGGTSCASPLWAAFTALINQQALANGKPVVGFLNPSVYTIGSGANYTNCFHDTTVGDNTSSSSPNLFYAVPGYDLCTGWGTPKGTNLVNALVGLNITPPHITPPPPPYGSTLAALKGGNPNGTWELFVLDDAQIDGGVISNGWSLTLITANPVGSAGDLALLMTASPNPVKVSSNLTCILTVTNYGPSISSNAIVSDDLPSGVTLVATNSTQGSLFRSGALLTWDIGTLAPNAGARLTLTLQPISTGTITNSAIAAAITSDPNPDDDSAFVVVNVEIPSPPEISGSFVSSNGTFRLSITGSATPTVIQASTNLFDWLPIYTNTPPFVFTDPDAALYPYRFYRAVVP
jgi:uncharacterized repeat protein (TIGR01451 family)